MLQFPNKPHNGGAKDGEFEMSLGSSESMGRVEPVARRGLACPQSLATARARAGHLVRQQPSHRHHLASSRRRQRRLSRLLLLPCGGGRTRRHGSGRHTRRLSWLTMFVGVAVAPSLVGREREQVIAGSHLRPDGAWRGRGRSRGPAKPDMAVRAGQRSRAYPAATRAAAPTTIVSSVFQ